MARLYTNNSIISTLSTQGVDLPTDRRKLSKVGWGGGGGGGRPGGGGGAPPPRAGAPAPPPPPPHPAIPQEGRFCSGSGS